MKNAKFKKGETVLYKCQHGYVSHPEFPFGLFTVTKVDDEYRGFRYYSGFLVNKNGKTMNLCAVDENVLLKLL